MKVLVLIVALLGAAHARQMLEDPVCSGEGLFPVPGKTCYDKYWSCDAKGSTPVEMPCAPGTVFDASLPGCGYEATVAGCPYVPDKCPGAGVFANGAICSDKFWACGAAGQDPVVLECAKGTFMNAYLQACDYKEDTPDCNGECVTPYYAVKATPELSILNAAIVATNLTDAVDTTNLTATIFAPTNKAFIELIAALGLNATSILAPENLPVVTEILLTHVVPDVAALSTDLKNGQVLPTLNGNQTLTVDLNTTGVVKIKPEGGAAATVVFPDLSFCKTVVHVIDKVLLPILP